MNALAEPPRREEPTIGPVIRSAPSMSSSVDRFMPSSSPMLKFSDDSLSPSRMPTSTCPSAGVVRSRHNETRNAADDRNAVLQIESEVRQQERRDAPDEARFDAETPMPVEIPHPADEHVPRISNFFIESVVDDHGARVGPTEKLRRTDPRRLAGLAEGPGTRRSTGNPPSPFRLQRPAAGERPRRG